MRGIEETLKRFLEKGEHKVLAIKGEWGIGKTFFWKQFFENNKSIVNHVAYFYISLFGIREISELKRQVFAKHVALNEKNL